MNTVESETKKFEKYMNAWILASRNINEVPITKYREVYKYWPFPGFHRAMAFTSKTVEEELEYYKQMERVKKCSGCVDRQPNQQAHMHFGGCLYDEL